MKVYLTVKDCGGIPEEHLSGRVRRYFLSAELVEWNYAPTGRNMMDGSRLDLPGR